MSEKGRTMLEILMVLAIIGVLTIFALFGFRFALKKHMANQAVKYVQVLAASSRAWMGTQMAHLDHSNEGLDIAREQGQVLGDYQKEYASLPLTRLPTSVDNFGLLPLDELMSGVRIKKEHGNSYFDIFEDAKVTAMLTKDNDLVINVEEMTVDECKQLVTSNVDSDEIIADLERGNRYIRCSATTYAPCSHPAECRESDCDELGNNDISLSELAEKICVEKKY